MTEDMQALRDDIAYLKALASGGSDGAITGGWILVAAGGFYGLASLVQWAALSRIAPFTALVSNIAWLVALVGFMVALFMAKSRQRRESASSKTAGMAWMAVGFGLFTIFAGIAIASWRSNDAVLISFSPTIVLALYGGAWSVAAAIYRRTWLYVTAFGSFAGALVSAWLVNDTLQWLFYAFALFMLALVPGIVALRGGRNSGE